MSGPFDRYRPRPLDFLGIEHVSGYRLKVYSIRYGDDSHDPARFDGGWRLAASALPLPPFASGRPGVGFAVLHQGRNGDYFILCWWDRENELPTRVFVNGAEGWRPAEAGESFCVWDLRVLAWERGAYVATYLAGRPDATEAYLGMTVVGFA